MSVTLTSRELSDLECLLDGSFFPLKGFMNHADYVSVVNDCHLSSGDLWSLPVVLYITEDQKNTFEKLKELTLRDETSLPIAMMSMLEIYKPDFEKECMKVYGTTDD